MESHASVPDATATFVRFAIAAGAMLPFADWAEKEVLLAGEKNDSGEVICSCRAAAMASRFGREGGSRCAGHIHVSTPVGFVGNRGLPGTLRRLSVVK